MTRIERGVSPTVAIVTRPVVRSDDWEDWALLLADLHWDNPHCDRALLKRHLDQALDRSAPVFVFGDLWCAMQGRYDKRHSKSALRPEHVNDRYLDSLVETAVEWFLPYKDVLTHLSPGNHESKIRKHEETDLCQRFAALYNAAGGHVSVGTYAGWVLMRHTTGIDKPVTKAHAKCYTTYIAYHHGHGGGGPVTKGVIQTNRRAIYLPDADIVVSGHIHEAWQIELARGRVTNQGRTYNDIQTHVQLGTYKEEYQEGEGWHVERGAPPKPMGGQWLRFYHQGATLPSGSRGSNVLYQVIRTEQ